MHAEVVAVTDMTQEIGRDAHDIVRGAGEVHDDRQTGR